MIVQADDMARDVRVAIDMNANNSSLLAEGDIDTLELDDIIYSKLADAVRLVEMEAPLQLLESGHDFTNSIHWESNGKGWLILPEDFMRLITFRMSDWAKPVHNAITEEDPLYLRQSSRFKGISGNPQNPVCAVVNRAEGLTLEFYSSKDNTASIEQAVYVPLPILDSNQGIDVSEHCYRAAVYRAASLALATVGDQLSTTMLDISKSLLT